MNTDYKSFRRLKPVHQHSLTSVHVGVPALAGRIERKPFPNRHLKIARPFGRCARSKDFITIAFLFAFLFVGELHCFAQRPEPAPAYVNATAHRADASLHAISFADSKTGIAVGDHGTILRTDNAGLTWQPRSAPVSCTLDDVIWLSDRHVIAVGGAYDRITRISRGVVVASQDGGIRWQRLGDEELPRLISVRRNRNGSLVAVGDWSESLMSRYFESRDAGKTWHASDPHSDHAPLPDELTSERQLAWTHVAGNHAPIRAVHRFDEQNVWAVGDHGLILHSKDGGQAWRESRGGGRHCAILVIANEPSTVAWSVIGKETFEMNHRVAMLVIQQEGAHDEISDGHRLALSRQAASAIGAAGLDLLAAADSTFEESLANWLAVHRPLVVLVDESIAENRRQQIATIAAAADVERIIDYSHRQNVRAGRTTVLHGAAMLPRIGVLAGDLTEDAFHLILPAQTPSTTTTLRRRYDRAGGSNKGESVASGISIPQQQKLSPRSNSASRRQLQIIQARMSEPKRMDDLVSRSESAATYASSLKLLLDQTADADRFRLAWNVLHRITPTSDDSSTKRLSFYEATLREFATRFDSLSSGKWAQLRLDAITHSLEWNRLRDSLRHSVETSAPASTVTAELVPVSPFQNSPADASSGTSGLATARWERNDDFANRFGSSVRQASATVPLLVADKTPTQINPQTAESSPVDLNWEFHPAVVIAREAARLRGDDDSLQSTGHNADLSRIAASGSKTGWSRLLGKHDVIIARRASVPPRLDGVRDDPCWVTSPKQNDGDPSIRFAYDDQYVYVAIRCAANQMSHDAEPSLSNSASTRDQNLTAADRIELRLDTDKDLLTSLRLEATDSGRTRDSIDGHPQWQPTWYVATNRTTDHVDIELAILRQDVSELPIHPGESWFVSARQLSARQQSAHSSDASSTPTGTLMPQPDEWRSVEFR